MNLHPRCWIAGDTDGLLYHLEIISEVEMNDGHFYTRCGQYLRVVHCELGVPDVKKCGVCFRSLDVASLESASSAGDTTELLTEVTAVGHERVDGLKKGSQASCGADAAPGSSVEFPAFAPQGASQGVSSTVEGHGKAESSDTSAAGIRPISEKCDRQNADSEQASPADSQGLTRGVDIQSSAALTEFDDCMYCNQRTVHCQAHARCLSCGEGCRECAVSGLSTCAASGAQCETSGECGEAAGLEQKKAVINGTQTPFRRRTPSLSNEHSPLEVSCGHGVQRDSATERDSRLHETAAGIPTFDEEYGRTYRGRLFTGNTIEELVGTVIRAEQGARR